MSDDDKELNLNLGDVLKVLDSYGMDSIDNVNLEGDLEIEVESYSGGGVSITPEMIQSMMVANEARQAIYHLFNLFKISY